MFETIFELLKNGKATMIFSLVLLFCSYMVISIIESSPDDLLVIIFGHLLLTLMRFTKITGFVLLGWGVFMEYLDYR